MYRTKQATLETTESEFTAGSRAGITRKGRGRRRGVVGILGCCTDAGVDVDRDVVESSKHAGTSRSPAPFGACKLRRLTSLQIADQNPTSTSTPMPTPSTVLRFSSVPPGFCSECHIPLAPDPSVEGLFIYLHAWRYTTEAWGEFSTPL